MTTTTTTQHQVLTISEAAKLKGVTRQAVFYAIWKKRLKAVKDDDQWIIKRKDLAEYFRTKYSRDESRKEGELVFDKNQGYFSVSEAAKMLCLNRQQLYFQIRLGRINAVKNGGVLVIKSADLVEFILHNPIVRKPRK